MVFEHALVLGGLLGVCLKGFLSCSFFFINIFVSYKNYRVLSHLLKVRNAGNAIWYGNQHKGWTNLFEGDAPRLDALTTWHFLLNLDVDRSWALLH